MEPKKQSTYLLNKRLCHVLAIMAIKNFTDLLGYELKWNPYRNNLHTVDELNCSELFRSELKWNLNRINLHIVDRFISSLIINSILRFITAMQENRLIRWCKKPSPHPISQLNCVLCLSNTLQKSIMPFKINEKFDCTNAAQKWKNFTESIKYHKQKVLSQ